MKKLLMILIICAAVLQVKSQETLLKNGELLTTAKQKAPTGWFMPEKSQPLKAISKGLPDGLTNGIEIDINLDMKSHGYFSQVIKLPSKNMKFSLTGMLKGTAPEIAYLQVKLFKDKKAIKTFSSKRNTTQWDKVILNFSAQDADSMQVLCRFVHGKKNIGQKVYFADIKLEKLKVIIALVGDSTVADYPVNYIQRGWGQMLPEYVNEDVGVINNAIPGCSTKTFLKGNHWDKTLEAKPDFILLQFGHNDSHRKGRPESTDANTDYKEYLRKYADDAKTNGTTIIFVTPMHRHIFKKGKLSENLKPYADAMKDVAKEKGIAVVDLYSLSGKALTEKGDEGSLYLFKNGKDRTHFCKAGATLMAELVVNELKKQKNTIAECFK